MYPRAQDLLSTAIKACYCLMCDSKVWGVAVSDFGLQDYLQSSLMCLHDCVRWPDPNHYNPI